ncbi:MAG: hypothetical protein MUC65_07525 [Pontiellaceae bacterium]|nr:hypothetical protein [Pontiellaceae bacterium]
MKTMQLLLLLFAGAGHAQTDPVTPADSGEPIYTSASYTVYSHGVKDAAYQATAVSPEGTRIFSPVMPGYRKTVDVSTVHPGNWFTPSPEISKFPRLSSGQPIIDAVYQCALDHLYRCSSGEFIRYPDKGEKPGMWQAGFRTGEGYGVWVRDVVYVSMLMGNLFDPEGARSSLAHVISGGIDNGEDGRALPAVGVWEYYCATGDRSLVEQTYASVKARLSQVEFDEAEGLGRAVGSTFLDTDFERQQSYNGGHAFSTQIVYAEAYRSMAELGILMREDPGLIDLWRKRSETIRQNVREKFWNESAGYYTEGRRGTKGYDEGCWENFGQSLAVWPRWKLADPVRTVSIFKNNAVARNEYGYAERPYIPSGNYLGRDVWVFTEVGQAIAAARLGMTAEVEAIFFSALRDAAMNKTFMECISWETGKGWRYPGQLWHAMGFVSMIYNAMLGMEVDQNGLCFTNPLVPEALKGMQIKNFRYRSAVFDIHVKGWGTLAELLLDGDPVDRIAPGLSGKHTITLRMNKPQAAGAPPFDLKIEKITAGEKHHFFGYIGQCQTIPWNAGGRYILGMKIEQINRMPAPEEAATIFLIDTRKSNEVIPVDQTHAWNPQQGTMFYWNPLSPETQFFFNDRDVERGNVFTVLYDIDKRQRVREYRYEDTPIGNSGVAPDGTAWLGLNYGRLARLRLVTGYPGALDWSKEDLAPENDGMFIVDTRTGEKRLLVSYRQLEAKLKEHDPAMEHTGLFINHTLWNRDCNRIYFFVRSGWDGKGGKRINVPCSIHADGTGLTVQDFIGGHPDWAEGSLLIGRQGKNQILYDVDKKKVVEQWGTPQIFPDPEGDISLSPDGQWFVNGHKDGDQNYYTVYRRSDGAFVRSGGVYKGNNRGDIRIDPAPCWNRSNNAILVPGIAENGTRQLFVIHVIPVVK